MEPEIGSGNEEIGQTHAQRRTGHVEHFVKPERRPKLSFGA
ncbi:hypothetical protein SDC9_192827 [bioreactor metagenome]|uniref:Uncharacterized protein n=1 Tax=bioreactor metagenome TaxID=1076179 RepID=A0A645I269_9ZZZZ